MLVPTFPAGSYSLYVHVNTSEGSITRACRLLYADVFVKEMERLEKGGVQEGALLPTQQAFRPHGLLPKTPLVISSTSIHLFLGGAVNINTTRQHQNAG